MRFDRAPKLIGRQPELLKHLRDLDPKLGQMYLGIYAAISTSSEPDRLEQACHSARELMEKLPRYVMETAAEERGSLKTKAQGVADAWYRYEGSMESTRDEEGPKAITRPLKTLIRQVKAMSEWMENFMPNRRLLTRNALRGLDVSDDPPLEAAENERVAAWIEWTDYFTNASHHRFAVAEVEVKDRLAQLDGLLIDLLIPSAVNELSELDEILAR